MGTEQFSLDGKTILVTGASSGIGAATAIACAKQGATVFITGRNSEKLSSVYSQIGGGAILAFPATCSTLMT